MKLEDVKKYLEENAKNEEVIDFMKSIQQPITRDAVEAWCHDGDGRSWLDRNCDIYATKAVNTARENAIAKFKQEELPKIIDDAIKAEMEKCREEIINKMTMIMEAESLTKEFIKKTFDEIRELVDNFEKLALERCK